MNRRLKNPTNRVIPTHMSHPFPIPSVPEIVPANIDEETKKMIEETSGNIYRACMVTDQETAVNLIHVAMLAAYRCGEASEAKKRLQSQEVCQP